MADAPAEASGEPAAPSAAILVAPPPVRGRIEREVSVSIGRVVVEWIDRPATEIPAITRPPAPARARGFTGIAAAWRGVLR